MTIKATKPFNDRMSDMARRTPEDEPFSVDEAWGKYLISKGYAEEIKSSYQPVDEDLPSWNNEDEKPSSRRRNQ